MSNARRLASAFGTEQDKYNCSFYHKVGACRHGDRCSRQHAAPALSETISIPNMYLNPFQVYETQGLAPPPEAVTEEALQKHLEDFFDDVHAELSNFGGVEDMHVCNNLGVHLNGRVYVKFEDEDSAQAAFNALQGRFYGGRMLSVEFSPVKNFREGRCKQFDDGTCKWGGNCNFMHVYQISDDLERELFGTKRSQQAPRRKFPRREARHEPMARRGLYSAPEDYEEARKYREGHGDDRRDSRGYDRPPAEDRHSRDRYDDRRPPSGDRYGGPPPGDRYGGPPPNDRYAEPPAEGRYGGPPAEDRYGGPPPGDRYGGPPPGDRYGGPPPGDRYGPPPGDRHDGPPRDGPRDGPPRDGRYGGPPGGDRYDGPPAHDRYEERAPPPSNA